MKLNTSVSNIVTVTASHTYTLTYLHKESGKNTSYHLNNNKHGDPVGGCHHEPHITETKDEAKMITAAVVRLFNALGNVDRKFKPLEFFVSQTSVSSLAVSHFGHTQTIIYNAPTISCSS